MRWFVRALRRVRWRHRHLILPALIVIVSELAYRARLAVREPPPPEAPASLDWGRGLSVVIPERGDPRMLGECLRALYVALAEVHEPTEVIVVVNGSERTDYDALRSRYPGARWLHFPRALGFTRAVLTGLDHAAHGATYLLNNDMLLEPQAFASALAWRGRTVFAIASQIFMEGEGGRREETGLTAMSFVGARPAPRHLVPPDESVRGTVWAGAGSALYNTRLLRRLLPDCLVYDPFYWEDVDLGVRAWSLGYQSLTCPASKAWHGHRVTVKRFYPAHEVSRIFERNRLLFMLRNPFPRHGLVATLRELAQCDVESARELGSIGSGIKLWLSRRRAYRAPFRDIDYTGMTMLRCKSPDAPRIIMASPFAILPPRHGGAVRTHRLAQQLARTYDVVLASDEADLYRDMADRDREPFSMVHFVPARPMPSNAGPARISRIESHSSEAFGKSLRTLGALYSPAAIVVEHVELAALIRSRTTQSAYVLSLHDVLLSPHEPEEADADAFELDLMDRFDGLVVSSPEDQAVLGARSSCLVVNGVDARMMDRYVPSTGSKSILFVGPFRAPNNWDGIVAFVESVYPELERQVPAVALTIIGGAGAIARSRSCAAMLRPSIRILEQVDDIEAAYLEAAVSINPQRSLRGSSLKVIESLAIGRACVSTATGARGHDADGFRGLVVVPCVEEFLAPLVHLLTHEAERIAIERPDAQKLERHTWDAAGRRLRAYVGEIVERRALLPRNS